MRHLLVHYAALLPRLVSSYAYLFSLGMVVWWCAVVANPTEWALMYVFVSTSLVGWFSILLLSQVVALHHVFFRSDALLVCVARVRSRAAIMGAIYAVLGILAVAYALPYALIFSQLVSLGEHAMPATLNMLVFNVFVVACGFGILRVAEKNNLGAISVVGILFVIPGILNMAAKLIGSDKPWLGHILGMATAHIRLLQNPDMLLVGQIQDVGALITTLTIAIAVSSAVFVRFLRKTSSL